MTTTLIIDTVDMLYPMAMDFVCKRLGVEHPSDADHGKGWAALSREWNRLHQKLLMMDCSIVYVSHSTEREVTRKHTKIHITQPNMSKAGSSLVLALSDIILFFGYDSEDKRKLYGMPKEDLDAGCRGGIEIDGAEASFDVINDAVVAARGKTFEEVAPTVLIFGPPKVGKSTLAMSFPNPVVIDLENGYKFLDGAEKYLCRDWQEFLDICTLIFSRNGNGEDKTTDEGSKE